VQQTVMSIATFRKRRRVLCFMPAIAKNGLADIGRAAWKTIGSRFSHSAHWAENSIVWWMSSFNWSKPRAVCCRLSGN